MAKEAARAIAGMECGMCVFFIIRVMLVKTRSLTINFNLEDCLAAVLRGLGLRSVGNNDRILAWRVFMLAIND